jgi:hypothetical protein
MQIWVEFFGIPQIVVRVQFSKVDWKSIITHPIVIVDNFVGPQLLGELGSTSVLFMPPNVPPVKGRVL